MARIDIEIEEYLDEVKTEYLVSELLRRDDLVKEILKHKDLKVVDVKEVILPELKTPTAILNYIKVILHLHPWHDKERIIKEINDL